MKFKKIFFIFFIYSCAYGSLPDFAKDPGSACSKNQICAVGEGSSLSSAQSDARANLAKVFETKIDSAFSLGLSQDEERANEFIQESTEFFLKGVAILKNHEEKGRFYSLASLDKNKMAKDLRAKISEKDATLSKLSLSKEASSILEAFKIYDERAYLNEKYLFLTNIKLPEVISYEELIKKKNDAFKNLTVLIPSDQGLPFPFLSAIRSEFTKVKAKIVTDKNKEGYKSYLSIQYLEKEESFKVKGFVKYQFSLFIKNRERDNSLKGEIAFIESFTGRDYEQAFSKAVESFSVYFNEHFHELNF